jgi:peptidoglycan/LPS O-acetylase OafA/YrhL
MRTQTVMEGATIKAPEKARFYRPELDVLRFIAFFLVFLCHTIPVKDTSANFMSGIKNAASMGVPVFFCLSSYLITELLLREKLKTHTINIPAFYQRRILRIWPLYFAALIAGFIFSPLIYGEKITFPALFSYIFLAGNWYAFFNGYLPLGSNILWSIGIEEQFYLVWPSLIRYVSRRGIIIASCLMWAASQFILLWLCTRPVVNPRIWVNTFPHLQYFAIGVLISAGFNHRLPQVKYYLRTLLIVAGLALFVAANEVFVTHTQGVSGAMAYPGYLIVGVGCAFLLIGMLGARIPRQMNGVVYLGKISYGLYVFHVWCLQFSIAFGINILHLKHHLSFVTFGVGFPLTVLASALSYRYFESPFLRLKERFEIVKSRTA